MAFQVDQCKNFKDGKKCEKCGRMMPAYCKDQQDLEEKAKKWDEYVASQGVPMVEPEAGLVQAVETTSEREADPALDELAREDKGNEQKASPEKVTRRPRGRQRKAR